MQSHLVEPRTVQQTKDKGNNVSEFKPSRPVAMSNRESQVLKIDRDQFNIYLDHKNTQPDEHYQESGLQLQGLIANAAATPTKKYKEINTLDSLNHNYPGLSKRNSLPNKEAFTTSGTKQVSAQRHEYSQLHSQTVETDKQGLNLQRKLINTNIRQSGTSDYYNNEPQTSKWPGISESPSTITQNKQLLRLNYNYNDKRDEGRVNEMFDVPMVSALHLKQQNQEKMVQHQAFTQSLDIEAKSSQKNAKIVFPTISLNHNVMNQPISSNDYNNHQFNGNVQGLDPTVIPWDKNLRSRQTNMHQGSPAQRRSETFKAGNLGTQGGHAVISSQEYTKASNDPQFRSSYLNSKRLSALRQQNQIKSEIKSLKAQASEIEKNGVHYAGGGINQVQFQSPNSLPLNHHKMQKVQYSNLNGDESKTGNTSVVLGKSINASQNVQNLKGGHPNPLSANQNLSEFSQYCDSLNIKKIKKNEGLISAGDKIIKRDQIQFASHQNQKDGKLLESSLEAATTPIVEKQSPRRGINGFQGSEYDSTGVHNSQFASRRPSKQGHHLNTAADYNSVIMSQGPAYEKKNWHTRALLSQSAANNLNLNQSIPFSSQDSPVKLGLSPGQMHLEIDNQKKSAQQVEQNSLQTKDNIKETYGQKTTLQEVSRVNNIGFQQQNSHLIYTSNVASIENSVQEGLQGLGYHQSGIRNSQSQELINKPQVQINRSQPFDQVAPQIQGNNGLFSIQKTQSGLDPNAMFKNEQRQKRIEEQRQYKQNDSNMFQPFSPMNHAQTKSIKDATGSELSLLCQFLAQTLRNERLQNQVPIPPQYHLDQSVVQQDLLQKAAAGLVPKEILQQIMKNEGYTSQASVSPRQAKADPLGYWSALYQASAQASAMRGSPAKPRQPRNHLQIAIDPSQNQLDSQVQAAKGAFENFTVEQLAQVRSLIGRRDNQELLREVSKALQNQEFMDQSQQNQPVNYTINQRIAHQKQYDRQRMFDFYKAIRIEDINDQAKSRMQAIALAPPSNPFKLRFAVLSGNNSRLIKIAMQRRDKFWEETTNSDPHFHFKWQPVSSGIKFDSVGKEIDLEFHPCQKQLVNHYEGHSCLSEKSKLFANMSRYASDKLSENVFDFMPLQFYVECDLSKQRQFSKNMMGFMNAYYALDDIKKRTKRYYNKIDGIADDKDKDNEEDGELVVDIKPEKDILDDQYIFKHYYQNQITKIKQHKREEREEREAFQEIMQHRAVKNKALEKDSGQETANNSGKEKSNQVDHKQTQLKMLRKHFFRQSMPFCHFSGHNMWILKATKLNQGQGIHVCNTLPQIKALIQKYCEGFSKKESESFKPEKEIQALRPEPLPETTPQKSSTRKAHSKSITKPARGKSENKIQNSVKLTESSGRTRGDSAKERGDPENRSPVSTKEPPGSADAKKRSPKLDQRDTKQYIMEEDIIDENDQESQNDQSDDDEKPENNTKSKRTGRMKYYKNTNKILRDKSEAQKTAVHQPQTTTVIKEGEPKYKHNSFIIQKYIERPLLIKQRKFDIRIWVFVNPQGDVYYCQKGYLRTSSTKYAIDPEDPDNRFVHLTNNAVQKYAVSFGQHEDGNILSLNQFQEYVDNLQLGRKYSVTDELIPNMKKQIARTLFATRKTIDPHRAQHAQHGKFFELFGYDFMIDEDFNTWLIEVNTNPSLSESSKYLCELVPRMIDDLVKITVDKEFYDYYCFIASQTGISAEEVNENLNIPSTQVRDFPDDQNIWEKFLSLNNKLQRKEDKQKWLQPIIMNSQYQFNIKGREFRIKKYIKPPPLEQKITPVTNYTEVKTEIETTALVQEDPDIMNIAQGNGS